MIEVNSFESFLEDDGQESGTQGGGTPNGGASLSFRSLYSHCAIPRISQHEHGHWTQPERGFSL